MPVVHSFSGFCSTVTEFRRTGKDASSLQTLVHNFLLDSMYEDLKENSHTNGDVIINPLITIINKAVIYPQRLTLYILK